MTYPARTGIPGLHVHVEGTPAFLHDVLHLQIAGSSQIVDDVFGMKFQCASVT